MPAKENLGAIPLLTWQAIHAWPGSIEAEPLVPSVQNALLVHVGAALTGSTQVTPLQVVQVEVLQSGQPLAVAVQVWRAVLDRQVDPVEFGQQIADPAGPPQGPFEQVVPEDS